MKTIYRRETILLIICVVLSIALLYLLMLNRWGILLWDKKLDYTKFGNWSDAISGLATSAAVIVALASLYWQRRTQQAAEDAKAIEAETAVFQWLTSKEVRDESDNLIGRVWDVKVQNTTAAPIYHWKLNFDLGSDHLCSAIKRPLIPGENFFNLPFLDNLEPTKAPEPTLIFQGHSGRFWSRSARGVVQPASDQELRCADAAGVSFALLG